MSAKCMFSFRQMEEEIMVTGVSYGPKELLTSFISTRVESSATVFRPSTDVSCCFLFSPPSKM